MDATQALAIAKRTLSQEAGTLGTLSNALDESFWLVARQIAECPGIVWVTGGDFGCHRDEICTRADGLWRAVMFLPILGCTAIPAQWSAARCWWPSPGAAKATR
jgi:hypothetical protein